MWDYIPHIMRANLLIHNKKPLSHYEFIEIKVWEITEDKNFPEGVKYSMVYIRKDKNKFNRILGFDNEKGKGHHMHLYDKEIKIEFNGWKDLLKQFYKKVEKLREDFHES